MRRTYRRLRPLAELLPAGVHPKLSVLMPVYNEAETVAVIIDQVLEHESELVDVELVIVESNSTDGSREVVEHYKDHPRVTLLLQADARGKGSAVREAMRHASGDITLIQDGDLEYEVSDYTALVAPIVRGEADFVLGTRYVKGRPIRWVPGAPVLSRVMNAAHWMFAALFNVTYGSRLHDPFTMFKVFRSDAVADLDFVADRFDFDWELMAKLLRSGYQPLEVPVTYHARGFATGKKIRPFADPPTWVWACAKFRFARLRRS
jgi:glycosyltransferase involved in cell wall biosynthesis